MKIEFKPSFDKSFGKLSDENKKRVIKTLKEFEENPFYPQLKNHKLKGEYQGIRSISAGYDLRILYREEGRHAVVYMIKLGTHDEVY